MEFSQHTYPYFYDLEEIELMDESDMNGMSDFGGLTLGDQVFRDSGKIWDVRVVCLEDYNSEEGTNLDLVKIEEAERIDACGGYIYFLTLIAQNENKEQRTIKKLAWQGGILEVLQTQEKSISPEQREKVNLEDGYWLGQAATMFHTRGVRGNLACERVIDFWKIPNPTHPSGFINKGAGYIDFSIYNVSVVATDLPPHHNEFIIEGVVRRSIWVLPLDKQMTKSILTWRECVGNLGSPPASPESSPPKTKAYIARPCAKAECPDYLHDLDLRSPQIITQAWFAVENYNLIMKTNLVFMNVERAALQPSVGILYDLILTAKDGPSLRSFTTKVRDIAFCSLWMCTAPLPLVVYPHGEAGSREQDDKIAVQGIASGPGRRVGMAF